MILHTIHYDNQIIVVMETVNFTRLYFSLDDRDVSNNILA